MEDHQTLPLYPVEEIVCESVVLQSLWPTVEDRKMHARIRKAEEEAERRREGYA